MGQIGIFLKIKNFDFCKFAELLILTLRIVYGLSKNTKRIPQTLLLPGDFGTLIELSVQCYFE
jgi:hypothetical protein